MLSVSKPMKLALVLAGLGIVLAASNVIADSTDARCDIYPKGASKPEQKSLCVFSQRQGYVTIDLGDGVYYDFKPLGGKSGQYYDSHGQTVYRQSGLGKEGLIFQLQEESVYIYWDTSGLE
ncbi:hypothetical protein L4D09_17400 [Photobacterium makurazakiensis]|uniref:hypothetical protein n=1 Tax=Photobacterium makurazakiensis TaxID=2910234 RepID=UPI003D0EED07